MKELLLCLLVLFIQGCAPFAIEASGSLSYGENQKVDRNQTMTIRHEASQKSELPPAAVLPTPTPTPSPEQYYGDVYYQD